MSITEGMLCSKTHEYLYESGDNYTIGLTDYAVEQLGDIVFLELPSIGDKFEKGETPDQCLRREVYEETGLKLKSYDYRGLIHSIPDNAEAEDMYLYTSQEFTGDLTVCSEGELAWIDKNKIFDLNLWEGDKVFLKKMINGERGFEISLYYMDDKCVKISFA